MYSVVWCKIDWVKDYCVNGEHDQQVGDHWLQVRRVIDTDNGNWKWVIAKEKCTFYFDWLGKYDQQDINEHLYNCSTDLSFSLDWAYKLGDLRSSWAKS